MKLKYKMSFIEMDGDKVAVPLGSSSTHYLLRINGTTSDILKILEKDVTEEEIIAKLNNEYDASIEEIRSSVKKVLDTLRENDLLVD